MSTEPEEIIIQNWSEMLEFLKGMGEHVIWSFEGRTHKGLFIRVAQVGKIIAHVWIVE